MYVKEILEFTNVRGNTVTFGGSPFGLVSVEGLGDVEADIQRQKAPYQDGSSFIVAELGDRHISMEFIIRGENYKEVRELRRLLSMSVSPKLGLGTLKYISGDGDVKEIEAVAESVPVFPDMEARGERWQRGIINFIAPNPYWRDLNQTSKPLQSYVGNFKLPMTFPFMLGVSGSRTELYNEGDVPASVQIEIHGPTTNPQVINRTTGEYIRINRAIAEDEVLHIDTTSGRQRVEIKRGNETIPAFGFLDHNGTLTDFKLDLGENEIEHVADAGNRNALVTITWQSMYVGI